VYGRMRPDVPAPTITSGFGSTGQGRFVHPLEPRTLTPREAARLQGFPDWFSFSAVDGRRALQEMIGNAVPSRLGYVAAMELLR
jgi:DNA (cytosine-5)-methyltransferase 1